MQNQRMGSSIQYLAKIVAISLLALIAILVDRSVGQIARPRQPRMSQLSMEVALMSAPREVLVLLDEAEEGIKKEQWGEATFALGILLGLEESRQADLTGADFFILDEYVPIAPGVVPQGPGQQIPGQLAPVVPPKQMETKTYNGSRSTVFKRVYELIESLPVEATKIVDLRYGAQAQQLLDEAIAESNWDQVAEVVSKYGFTSSGQDATVILGQHWLRKGDPRRAARLFTKAFRQKSASERLGPELGILAASTLFGAGMQSEALTAYESTRMQFRQGEFTWKGTRVSWDGRSVLSKTDFDKMELSGQQSIERVIKQPYYQSGIATRNADTNAGIPLPFLSWHAELHESEQHKENLDLTLKQKLPDGKSNLIPSRYPISVGPWVIASTYDQRIVAIDALTGVLRWQCAYSGMPMGFSMDRYLGRDGHSYGLPAPDYLTKRVWGETMLGGISSDGERIYNISEMPAFDIAESFALGPNARVAKPKGTASYNVMQCWSVREEGKAQWEVGGQKSTSEPKLAGTLFLGAPLPYENDLLVLGELNSDLFLHCIEPETGKLLWRQPLTTNHSTIANDLLRRSTGAIPAVDGSIVICPTLSGYLIAYDIANRSILWAFKYPLRADLSTSNQASAFGALDLADLSPLTPRSADNSVIISDGVVLFAPADGSDAYGIQIEDGTLLWKLSDSTKAPIRYIAGAWNNTAVVVCQTSVAAVDLKSGKSKWPKIDFPGSQQVIGRGVRKQGTYLVPLSSQNIVQIDILKGAITDFVRVEQPLGNLISVGDRLICATPFQLDCYSVREAFQTQLKEELQRGSTSVVGLARQSELALAKGDFDGALNYLEQARKIDPNNADVILLINKAGIAALTADFDKYANRVDLLGNLVVDRDKAPYLRLLIKGFQKQGRNKETLATLFELSNLRTSQRQEQMSGVSNIELSSQWSIQEDRWIETQFRNVITKLTPTEMGELKKQIAPEIESMRSIPSHVLRVKLAHFDAIRETEPLRLESAKMLVLQKNYLQAERMLVSDHLFDKESLDSIDAAARRDILASIYVRNKRFDLAAKYVAAPRFEELVRELNGMPANGLLLPESPSNNINTASKPLGEWPTGKVNVSVEQSEDGPLNQALRMDTATTCKWKTKIGDALSGWEIKSGGSGGVNVVFTNPSSGVTFQVYFDAGNQDKFVVPTVHSVDSIVLLEVNRQIIAVDTLTGSMRDQESDLWRQQFDMDLTDMEINRGQKNWGLPSNKGSFKVASVSRSGIIVLSEDELICCDLVSGAKIWTRKGFKGCSFASENDSLVVHDPKNRSILKLDVLDGSTLSQIPLEGDGGSAVASIGRYWLLGSDGQKQLGLRLVDSSNGKAIFNGEFTSTAKIALDGDTGIIILKENGELTYWNLADQKEFVRKIEIDSKFKQVSIQRFGETMLMMLLGTEKEPIKPKITPDASDPDFVPVSGRVHALSAKDASDVWLQSSVVSNFSFPINQIRNSPAAVFVRMLNFSRVANTGTIDCMSIAVVDIRNGRVLFSSDEILPATRGLPFTQEILADQNTMKIDYLGSSVELNWTNTADTEEPVFDFGNFQYPDLKKRIEAKVIGGKPSDLLPQTTIEPAPNK